jgi:hypothetical protein
MNKWGIGLTILNLLAAAGITYLALDDRSTRHEIDNAVVRHYLALNGLPLDGAKVDGDTVQMRVATANGVPVDRVGLDTLRKYLDAQGGAQFGAAGSQVTTQLEEVNRVVQMVNTAVSAMPAPKQKLDFLVGSFANPVGRRSFTPGILVYLAENADEREAARALAVNPNGANADAAQKLFAAKAAAVTAPAAPVADAVWRTRIAQFLLGLEPTSDDWQKRVAQVVGLRTYVKALAAQDLAFQEIASRVTRRIEDDQKAFVDLYQQLGNLSIQLSLLLSREEEVRNELDVQQQKDGQLLNTKQSQKAKTEKVYEDLVKAVTEQSSTNAALETAVHTTQRTVGQLLDEILKLEAELDAAELQRSKGR